MRHNGDLKEATRQTIKRRLNEPRLEVGDIVPIKDGVAGVVLARFIPSGRHIDEVHYIVELRSDKTTKEE